MDGVRKASLDMARLFVKRKSFGVGRVGIHTVLSCRD